MVPGAAGSECGGLREPELRLVLSVQRRRAPRGPGPGRPGAGGGLPGPRLGGLLGPGQLGPELWAGGRGRVAGWLRPPLIRQSAGRLLSPRRRAGGRGGERLQRHPSVSPGAKSAGPVRALAPAQHPAPSPGGPGWVSAGVSCLPWRGLVWPFRLQALQSSAGSVTRSPLAQAFLCRLRYGRQLLPPPEGPWRELSERPVPPGTPPDREAGRWPGPLWPAGERASSRSPCATTRPGGGVPAGRRRLIPGRRPPGL